MFYVLNYKFAINIWQWCPGGCCVEFDFWRNGRFWLVLELTSPPQIIYSSTITFELFFFQKFRRFKTWSISDSGITVDKCLLKLNSKLRYRIFYSEYRSHEIKPNQTYHFHIIINRIYTKNHNISSNVLQAVIYSCKITNKFKRVRVIWPKSRLKSVSLLKNYSIDHFNI